MRGLTLSLYSSGRTSLRPKPNTKNHLDERATLYTAADDQPQWGKVIDHTRCIGCHACTTACNLKRCAASVTRTYVKHVDFGEFHKRGERISDAL